ncbi:MAG: adenosylcobalamin-dependent ribonucleoside-diphosphate reductase [Flavobacteriaceae bacterium]|jgi:ribonucleoside-diphosphate reductase alpha chain|nr:adenosylcobalamin-dependent ribonucleoside-diphosphate reductase [Flavobacteriaceae bacterium]
MEMTKKEAITNTFSEKTVREETLKYFNGDELAATSWMKKYAVKNNDGDFLEKSPEEMHHRLAKEFSRIETKFKQEKKKNGLSDYGKTRSFLSEDHIFSLFDKFKYVVPQGSVMAALGNKNIIASLSNCVVIPPVYDSYGGIMRTDEQLAQLFKRRCGVGVDISGLRPKNSHVSNSAGTTTGAISFMNRFSNTTREVAQNGRRGALMLTIDIAHPDVEDFVLIKQDLTKITGANISVRLSDEFMQAVVDDTEYTHRWPIDSTNPEYKKTVKAGDLWNTIVESAHNTAEPGLIFWDRQHKYSTSSIYPDFKNDSTNPCSEIAMQGGDSCRLIAVNLYSFVNKPFTEKSEFDFDKFYEIIYESQRLNDDLVELELEAVDRILAKIEADKEPDFIKLREKETWELLRDTGKKGRRTGLGFTALADTIASMGFAYSSDEALRFVDEMMKTKCRAEFDSSIDMAIERGQFKAWDPKYENDSEFVQMLQKELPDIYDRMMKYGRRNISLSTVAPTGTLSILTQTSSGIEPVFSLGYKRRRKVNANDPNANISYVDETGDAFEEFDVWHHKLQDWMNTTGETDVDKSPYAGSTAVEIDWIKRVEMQAIVQKYTTHSISSTINLPSDVSVEKVGEIYIESWKQGLKGITVYRDGSRSGVLISIDKDSKKETELPDSLAIAEGTISITHAPKRPKRIEADIIRFQNEYEKWLAVVGLIDGKPYEVFTGKMEDAFNLPVYVNKGWVVKNRDEEKQKSRYDFQYIDKEGYRVTIEGLSRSFDEEYWNYAKLLSGILRHGMPINNVVNVINGLNLYDENINTWKNGVARALKKYIPDGTTIDKECPSCGDPNGLIYEEGCLHCKSCGYSKCG